MKVYTRFIGVWFVNFLVFYLANKYFVESYVLGNAVITPIVAATVSGFLLTLFTKFSKSLKSVVKLEKAGRIEMFLIYTLVNAFGIWLLAKISPVSGFGIPAFYLAIYLGFVASTLQWLLRQLFKATSLQ